MIQLNLLPDIKIEYLKSQRSKKQVTSVAILVTVIAGGLTAALFSYVNFIQPAQQAQLTKSIESRSKELKRVNDIDKYLTVQNQLAALPELHDKKGNYSRIKEYLIAVNPTEPNNMRITNLSLTDESKTITLKGSTASYQTFNVLVDTLQNAELEYRQGDQEISEKTKLFSSVTVKSSNLSKKAAEGVSFTVDLVYEDIIFDTTVEVLKASVPNITTTQSVVNSPNVFSNDQEGGSE